MAGQIRLASTADIASGLLHMAAEMLGDLRNFLSMDRLEHHSTDLPKETVLEKGSGRHSTIRCRERSAFNQTNMNTLRRLLREGAVHVWAFPSALVSS